MFSSNDRLPLTIEAAATRAEQSGVTRAEFNQALQSGALVSTWGENTSMFSRGNKAETGILDGDLTDWLNRR